MPDLLRSEFQLVENDNMLRFLASQADGADRSRDVRLASLAAETRIIGRSDSRKAGFAGQQEIRALLLLKTLAKTDAQVASYSRYAVSQLFAEQTCR